MINAAGQRTALYRFYDTHERLLYVGITDRPGRRWQEHMEEKPWYPQVQHQAATWYRSEQEARRAETRAIRAEHPKFNVVGAVRPASWRIDFRDQPLGLYAATLLTVPGAYFGIARLAPAATPLAVLTVPVVAALVVAIIAIRGTQCIHRFIWWIQCGNQMRYRSGPPAEARILQLVAEGRSASKAGVMVGRSDSYGRQVVRKARELTAVAPKGQGPEE